MNGLTNVGGCDTSAPIKPDSSNRTWIWIATRKLGNRPDGRDRSRFQIELPARRPGCVAVELRLRARDVDLNAMPFAEGVRAEAHRGFKRFFAGAVAADSFAVAKQRPADRRLHDIVNMTSHR